MLSRDHKNVYSDSRVKLSVPVRAEQPEVINSVT